MKKKDKTMLEVTKGYEDFIKGKETNKNGQMIFNKVIKKAAKPKTKKPHATK
jgi:hypothetical protein